MSLRRAGLLALPLALAACTEVTQQPPPADLVFAAFASPNIPTPNDLALASTVKALPIDPATGASAPANCATPVDLCKCVDGDPANDPGAAACSFVGTAQGTSVELLCALRVAGGFPADQESTIAIPVTATQWTPGAGTNGAYVQVPAPLVDAASIRDDTVAVYQVDVSPPVRVAVELETDPLKTYAGGPCSGTGTSTSCTPGQIVLRKVAVAGSRRWTPGARYAFALRGGPSGVTLGGKPLSASSPIELAIPNRDLTKQENQPLGSIPDGSKPGECFVGTSQDEIGLLETVRNSLWQPLDWANTAQGWRPIGAMAPGVAAFAAVQADQAFPYAETAVAATFGVAPLPASPAVFLTDSGSASLPFPSDFLLGASGKVRNIDSLCRGVFDDPANKTCPLSRGLSTLDGFSTTAPLTFSFLGTPKQGSPPANAVFVFDLSAPTVPVNVGGGVIVNLPPLLRDVTVAGAAADFAARAQGSTVALAPGVPVPGTSFYLPPLKPKHRYAVVVTDKLLDAADAPVAPGTLGKILWKFTGPISSGGKSTISSIPDPDALSLQTLRDSLSPLLAGALPAYSAGAVTKANVVMAYTVLTQDVTTVSQGLAAAPYALAALPPTVSLEATPAQWEAATGFPAAALPTVSKIIAGRVKSLDALSASSGALNPSQGQWTPTDLDFVAALPAVDPATCNATTRCARPLVVFHHGFTGSRMQMLPLAGALAQRGFIVAAIDAPFHGDRAYCTTDAECTTGPCTPAPTVTDPTTGGQVPNQKAPATCGGDGSLVRNAELSTDASGKLFVSTNFFRTRDAVRLDLIDQSALVVGLAPPTPRGTDDFAARLAANGLSVDNTRVYFTGQSLGGIIGTSVVATNPRFSKALLNVPGGTLTDVFTTSPRYTYPPNTPENPDDFIPLEVLIQPLIPGFTVAAVTPGNAAFNPGMYASYQQLLMVAKWILDPADPVNYAASVVTKLPSSLAGILDPSLVSATTAVFGQMAQGDTVVPTPTNRLLFSLMATTPALYKVNAASPNDAVDHGYLISAAPFNRMQTDAASFLFDGALPPDADPATTSVIDVLVP